MSTSVKLRLSTPSHTGEPSPDKLTGRARSAPPSNKRSKPTKLPRFSNAWSRPPAAAQWLASLVGIDGLTLEALLGYACAPLAFAMGVPREDCLQATTHARLTEHGLLPMHLGLILYPFANRLALFGISLLLPS
eukprot:6192653-Pleurochrysis_carterae.AAC.2